MSVGSARGAASVPADASIRIVVVHHQPILRSALASLLHSVDGFAVVGELCSCAECCQKIANLRPDVLLCHLPASQSCKTSNVDCLGEVNPKTPVIVFTGIDAHLHIISLAKRGFKGLLTNNAPCDDLFQAVRAVGDGGRFLDQRAQAILVDAMGGGDKRGTSTISDVTERERTVLEFLAQGKTNAQIAAELHLSTSTVKHCVSSILSKLNASNRTAAVRIAAAKGLLPG